VWCLSLGRFSEFQTLHFASVRAADSTKHQNRVLTGWTNEYLLLFAPIIPRGHTFIHWQILGDALVH